MIHRLDDILRARRGGYEFRRPANHIRRLVHHKRRHWPDTHIAICGDGHYGRPEPAGGIE
jgi:hypothetical protein